MTPPPSAVHSPAGGAAGEPGPDAERTAGAPTLTQAVAPRSGAISVRGTVTAAGARLVTDTVEALRRRGHQRVLLHLADAERIDEDGLAVLHSCRERILAEGGALHIFGEPGPDEGPSHGS